MKAPEGVSGFPWVADDPKPGARDILGYENNDGRLTLVACCETDEDRRFILAAPKMYEALYALIGALGLRLPPDEIRHEYGEVGYDAVRRANEALDFAEGKQ